MGDLAATRPSVATGTRGGTGTSPDEPDTAVFRATDWDTASPADDADADASNPGNSDAGTTDTISGCTNPGANSFTAGADVHQSISDCGCASSMAANALSGRLNQGATRSELWPSTTSPQSRSRPAMARWCWRRGPRRRIRDVRQDLRIRSSSMTARSPHRRQAHGSSGLADPPRPPFSRPRRSLPTGSGPSRPEARATASIWRSAIRRATGWTGQTSRPPPRPPSAPRRAASWCWR